MSVFRSQKIELLDLLDLSSLPITVPNAEVSRILIEEKLVTMGVIFSETANLVVSKMHRNKEQMLWLVNVNWFTKNLKGFNLLLKDYKNDGFTILEGKNLHKL